MSSKPDSKETDGLKHTAIRGGMMLLAGRVISLGLNVGSMLILARMLMPEDFGLFAMIAVVMNFLVIFTDPGLSTVTMQKQNITRQQISNLFWVNVGLGVVLALCMLMIGPVIAWLYGEERVLDMIWALAVVFVLSGLGVQHDALLRRDMRFKSLVALELGALIGSIFIGLYVALHGGGYWALVVMPLSAALLKTMGLWLMAGWMPQLPLRNSGTLSLLKFGGHLTASNVVTYLMKNVDDMLIGWRWGAASLGFYNMAYRLFLQPVQQVGGSLGGVAIVTLSKLTLQPDRFKSFYLRMVMAISYVSMPLIVLIGLLSEDIFLLLLGDKWLASADIFAVFACAALLQPITATLGWVVISYGYSERVWRWSLFGVPVMIAGFVLGLAWGGIGVAVGYTVAFYILSIPHVIYYLRGSPVRAVEFWLVLLRPFCISLVMGLAVIYVRFLLDVPLLGLFGLSLLAAALVLLVLVLIWPAARMDMHYIIGIVRFAIQAKKQA